MEYSQELREAIQSAFPTVDGLRLFVRERLYFELADITSLQSGRSVIVSDLLVDAQSRGGLGELVWEAHGRNPGNPKLRKLIAELSPETNPFGEHEFGSKDWKRLASELGASERGASERGGLENIVLAKVPFADIAPWLAKLARAMRRVCRIEPQPLQQSKVGYGSGFLVARDVVMTNCHVVEGLASAKPEAVRIRFDHFVDEGEVATPDGRTTSLATEWDLLRSPINELDFALIRLAEPVGDDKLPFGLRSHFGLAPRTAGAADPLLILQHPDAMPLKLALGSITRLDQVANRLAYKVNTMPGSSGSPCLSLGLDVVALHHFGSNETNRGVTLDAIVAKLQEPANATRLAAAGVTLLG
jgi:Trypsin-like peptidase domain/Effector-associated domain 1